MLFHCVVFIGCCLEKRLLGKADKEIKFINQERILFSMGESNKPGGIAVLVLGMQGPRRMFVDKALQQAGICNADHAMRLSEIGSKSYDLVIGYSTLPNGLAALDGFTERFGNTDYKPRMIALLSAPSSEIPQLSGVEMAKWFFNSPQEAAKYIRGL